MWIRKALRDLKKGVDSPMPTQAVSNEEFIPRPQSEPQKQVEQLIGAAEAKSSGGDKFQTALAYQQVIDAVGEHLSDVHDPELKKKISAIVIFVSLRAGKRHRASAPAPALSAARRRRFNGGR